MTVLNPFSSVAPTAQEIAARRPGDDLLPGADVVMDRAFTVPDAAPEVVWPWIVQLGKGRGGWYLPARIERLLPRRNRAGRTIQDRWQHLAVGDVIPDYGRRDDTFTVARIEPPRTLLHTSQRGRVGVTWAITLAPSGDGTRVALRLRLHPVQHVRLASTLGGFFDLVTIAGMAAGLRERVRSR